MNNIHRSILLHLFLCEQCWMGASTDLMNVRLQKYIWKALLLRCQYNSVYIPHGTIVNVAGRKKWHYLFDKQRQIFEWARHHWSQAHVSCTLTSFDKKRKWHWNCIHFGNDSVICELKLCAGHFTVVLFEPSYCPALIQGNVKFERKKCLIVQSAGTDAIWGFLF